MKKNRDFLHAQTTPYNNRADWYLFTVEEIRIREINRTIIPGIMFQRIPFACLMLFAAVLALTSSMFASAFEPSMPMSSRGRTILRAEEVTNGSSEAATTPDQKEFGQSLELPNTYASCGQCGSSFALTLEAMGPGKGGRYVSITDCTLVQ